MYCLNFPPRSWDHNLLAAAGALVAQFSAYIVVFSTPVGGGEGAVERVAWHRIEQNVLGALVILKKPGAAARASLMPYNPCVRWRRSEPHPSRTA